MWPPPPSSSRPTLGYSLPSEMGMFVVAPATSFHHHHHSNFHHHHESVNNSITDSHHHHHHHVQNSSSSGAATALGVGVGVGVIPLLTATPCLNVSSGGGGGGFEGDDLITRGRTNAIQLWQSSSSSQQQQQQVVGSYSKKSINFEQGVVADLLPSTGGGGTMTCQDCGNQAKKDCSHRRCRTCCRSRGFECSTHVKSTWVPAARRRERQMLSVAGCGGGAAGAGGGASSGSTSGAKKPRLISSQNTTTTSHTSTSNTPPRSFDTSSSHQDAGFKETLPGQVKAPAVFKCVRVTAVEDGEDEYAYQAVVKIGGHVFKGFLYDQGLEPREGFPNLSDLHLGGATNTSGGGGGRSNGAAGASSLLDPADVYGASGAGALLGGSSFGNTIA